MAKSVFCSDRYFLARFRCPSAVSESLAAGVWPLGAASTGTVSDANNKSLPHIGATSYIGRVSSRKRDHDSFGPAVPAPFLSNVIPLAEQISVISNRCRALPPGFDR